MLKYLILRASREQISDGRLYLTQPATFVATNTSSSEDVRSTHGRRLFVVGRKTPARFFRQARERKLKRELELSISKKHIEFEYILEF